MKIFLTNHVNGENVSFALSIWRKQEIIRRNRVKLNC